MPTERDIQTKLGAWVKAKWKETAVFEFKVTKDKSIPFDAVKPHQVAALLAANSETGLYFKIPDAMYGYNPFDAFFVRAVSAYVVIMFYRRGQKDFYMIKIEDWIRESKNSKRKSLTEERASSIGIKFVL